VLGVPSKGLLGLGLSEEQLQSGFLILVALPLIFFFYRIGTGALKRQ
jgi:hypothetical protein